MNFINKTKVLEKNESSLLLYNYRNIEGILKDCVSYLYQNQHISSSNISKVDFSNSSSKIEIFYQDMYYCLYGDSQIIIFDDIL